MPRYKCKSIAALDIALGGLPAKMQVEADAGTGVSAKTVGELRKVTTWSDATRRLQPAPRPDLPQSVVADDGSLDYPLTRARVAAIIYFWRQYFHGGLWAPPVYGS